jgi:hypothetical protein
VHHTQVTQVLHSSEQREHVPFDSKQVHLGQVSQEIL